MSSLAGFAIVLGLLLLAPILLMLGERLLSSSKPIVRRLGQSLVGLGARCALIAFVWWLVWARQQPDECPPSDLQGECIRSLNDDGPGAVR